MTDVVVFEEAFTQCSSMLPEVTRGTPTAQTNPIEAFLSRFGKENTRRKKAGEIKRFYGVSDVRDITTEMIFQVNPVNAQDWFFKNSNYAYETLNGVKTTMLSLYSYFYTLSRMDHFKINPFKMVRFESEKDRESYGAIFLDEVKKLVNHPSIPFVDQTMYETFGRSGLRVGELVRLNLDLFTQINDHIYIFEITVKGSKKRKIAIPSTLYSKFVKIVHLNTNDLHLPFGQRRIFPFSPSTILRKHCGVVKDGIVIKYGYFHTVLNLSQDEIKRRNLTTHSFRSCTATEARRFHHGDVNKAKTATGHESTDVFTNSYDDFKNTFEEHFSLHVNFNSNHDTSFQNLIKDTDPEQIKSLLLKDDIPDVIKSFFIREL